VDRFEERVYRVVGLLWVGLNVLLCWQQLIDLHAMGTKLPVSNVFASLLSHVG
jgi:hypothetical protein